MTISSNGLWKRGYMKWLLFSDFSLRSLRNLYNLRDFFVLSIFKKDIDYPSYVTAYLIRRLFRDIEKLNCVPEV